MPPATCIRSSRTRLAARSRTLIEPSGGSAAATGAADRAAHLALPPRARGGRHRRARDLEPHREDALCRRRDRRTASAFTGSTAPPGTRDATPSVASIFATRAARDRELDGGRARAASSSGVTAVTCACAATRYDRACCPRRRCASGFRAGAIKLGAAARLYPVKGLAIVLHAVAALRPRFDVELQLAGAGPELERLRSLGASARHLREQVTFHGAVAT